MKNTLFRFMIVSIAALGMMLAAQSPPESRGTGPGASAPADAKAVIDALGMVSAALTEFPQAVAAATAQQEQAPGSEGAAAKVSPGEGEANAAADPAQTPNGEPAAVRKQRPLKSSVIIITSGAATGAAIGAAISKNSKGAIAGAVVGAVAGLIYDRATYKVPGVI